MQLLAPMMMLGAAAVTVPIALHFFYRARYKPLPWAPMKFLKEAIEQTSRRLKFQEWLLLLLRCLVIILLALAIARPGWESTSSAGASETIDAVFVFDTSYSMGARDGEKTRIERAKEAALAVLETLPNKSSIQVYSCSDRAVLLGPVSRYNRDQAKQLIQAIELTSLSTDFLPGLTDALAAAQTGTAPAKEIYVFTDMQKTGFERQQTGVRAKCEEIKAKANLIFIRCGNPERKVSNVSITDVKLLAAIPHTRTRVPFVVTLKNTGREPIRNVKVSLELDGKAVEKEVVQVEQIEAGANEEVTLTGSLDEAGARLIAVYVDGDGVEGDNVLYKIVGVRDRVNVLLVAYPFAGQQATDAGDWFARKALVPFDADKDKDKIERYFIATESALPPEAGPDKLAGRDIVYLLNTAVRTDDPFVGMSPAFVAKLTEFVKNGGGLIIGCGDMVKPADYTRVLGREGAGLLPLPLTDVQNTTDASPFKPAAESIDDKDEAFGKVKPYTDWLGRATFTRMVQMDEKSPDAAGARVLMRTTDGKPLVASRTVGEGEVIFFATALDETWGSRMMSDGQLAIPMTTYLVSHLTGRKVPGGTRMAGDTLTWVPPVTAPGFELVKPRLRGAKSGDKVRPRVKLGEAKAEAGQKPTVSTNEALVAGEYAIVPVGAQDTDGITFAVNPDLRETENLDVISDSELEKLLGFAPTIIQAGAGTETAVRERRTRGEWTEWVLLALLFLMVGEAAWACFCGKAW